MLKPGLEKLFRDYADSHQHPTNQLTHKIAMPLIVFHVLVMLDWVKLFTVPGTAVQISLAYLFYAGAVAWYLTQDVKLGMILAVLCLPCIPLGWYLPKLAVVAIAGVAWAIQLAGHALWEKKSPAFLTNLLQALVGPLFFVALLTGTWSPKAPQVAAPRAA